MKKYNVFMMVAEEGFTARSLLRSDFLSLLNSAFEKIVIFVPKKKLSFYNERNTKSNVIYDVMETDEYSKLQKIFFKIVKFSIHSQHNRIKLMRTIFDQYGKIIFSRWLLFFPFLYMSWQLGRFSFWRKILRKIYSMAKVDTYCMEKLNHYKPDVVYGNYSDIGVNNFNLELFKAAQYKGITTIGNIFSWDNLYSKVFLITLTDYLTVPNNKVREDAIHMGDFSKDKIVITGLPHFDMYENTSLAVAREKFFKQIGADPKKKLIIFALGNKYSEIEIDFIELFRTFENFAKNSLHPVQFYIRPYPKRPIKKELVDIFGKNPYFIFEQQQEEVFLGSKGEFEFGDNDNMLLYNLMMHGALLISCYSTMLVDGSAVDLPTIVINYSSDSKKRGYFYEIERHLVFDHIVYIFTFDAIKIANSTVDLLKYMENYLQDAALDREKRKKLAEDQLGNIKGKSANILFGNIINIIETKNFV